MRRFRFLLAIVFLLRRCNWGLVSTRVVYWLCGISGFVFPFGRVRRHVCTLTCLNSVERNYSRHSNDVQKQNNEQCPRQLHVWLWNAFEVHPFGRRRRPARSCCRQFLSVEKARDPNPFHCGSVCTSLRN